MELQFQHADLQRTVTVQTSGQTYHFTVGERTLTVNLLRHEAGRFDVEIDGTQVTAYAMRQGEAYYLHLNGESYLLQEVQPRRRRVQGSGNEGSNNLRSPMPGSVRSVLVQVGDRVKSGDTLILLEAMKMELRVTAPQAGYVKVLHCQVGEVVQRGQVLVELGE